MKKLFTFLLITFFVSICGAQTEPEVVSTDEDTIKRTIPDVRETVSENSKDEVTLPPKKKKTDAPESLEERKKKMVFYLDLLTKTESRAENLRKSLFEMIEKENSVKSQIRNVEYALRPDQLRNATALSGSLRPEDVRAERERLLRSEKANLDALLSQSSPIGFALNDRWVVRIFLLRGYEDCSNFMLIRR